MRAIFPYAGSSQKYAALIAEMIRREGYETYAEPMVGSGAVFFELAPICAYIGDVEPLHINFYACVRDRPELVIDRLDLIVPVKEWFIASQETICFLDDSIQMAAEWYALLILCYNGVVKKRNGLPYLTWGDRYLTWRKRLPGYKQRLLVASNILKGTLIYSASYELCPQADIAFFDPPWFESDEDYGVNFNHHTLAEYLATYHGKWLLTINDTERAREVYSPAAAWMKELQPYYSVSPTTEGRFKRCELLMANFRPQMFGG